MRLGNHNRSLYIPLFPSGKKLWYIRFNWEGRDIRLKGVTKRRSPTHPAAHSDRSATWGLTSQAASRLQQILFIEAIWSGREFRKPWERIAIKWNSFRKPGENMVPPTRIERAARGLGNRCSIQLSYGGSLYNQHVTDSLRQGKLAGVIRVLSLADAFSKSSSFTWLYRLYIFSDL